MGSGRDKPFELSRAEQFRAFSSPIRRRLVFIAGESGPCSVGDLAQRTGRSATALYRHVKILVGAGLLVEAGHRGEGREREALYRTPSKVIRFTQGPLPRGAREEIAKGIAGDLRRASRTTTAALRSGRGVPNGPDRDTWAGTAECWLTPEQLKKVNEHLLALGSIIADAPERAGTKPYGVVHVVYPLDAGG